MGEPFKCKVSVCCFSCVSCELAGLPKSKVKADREGPSQARTRSLRPNGPQPQTAAGAAPETGASKDLKPEDVDVEFGVANGVHFTFNYCLFCSVTPVAQS
jgi:hypothetical protein